MLRGLLYPVIGFMLAFMICFPGSVAVSREAGWVPITPPKGIVKPDLKRPVKTVSRTAPKSPVKKRAGEAVAEKPDFPLKAATVYDNQPPVTEKELNAFEDLLPKFRAWARSNGEEAHPLVNKEGKPDFLYSEKAASWVRANNFDPVRFFCVMGRMAAALVIVEEGNDLKGTRPADMPPVAPGELGLARRHLGSLLTAGGVPQPITH